MTPVPFTGSSGIGNEFVTALLGNENFNKLLSKRLGDLSKADTIQQATNLLWYDLKPVVQMLYPYRELIPRISRLPRVGADGGNSFHWKRITGINVRNICPSIRVPIETIRLCGAIFCTRAIAERTNIPIHPPTHRRNQQQQ